MSSPRSAWKRESASGGCNDVVDDEPPSALFKTPARYNPGMSRFATTESPQLRPTILRRAAGVLLSMLVLLTFATANFVPHLVSQSKESTVLAYGWPHDCGVESIPWRDSPFPADWDLKRATFSYRPLGMVFDALVATLGTVGMNARVIKARWQLRFSLSSLLLVTTFAALFCRSLVTIQIWYFERYPFGRLMTGDLYHFYRGCLDILLPIGACCALYAFSRLVGAFLQTESPRETDKCSE